MEETWENELTNLSSLELEAARVLRAEVVTWQGRRALRLDGLHQLQATLKATEGFNWGLTVRAAADGLRWLPATSSYTARRL